MSSSSFKIAHKLLTGAGAIEQLAAELTRLDVDNPLIVTDAALVKSGTVALALEHLGERTYEIFDRVLPDPEISIVEDCMQAYRDGGHDGLMAGMAFGNAGVGAVHALAYPLGGRFNIAHGVSNALLLPYVMHWNKLACVERMQDIAQAMGVNINGLSVNDAADQAVEAMTRLCTAVEIPAGLRSFGVPEESIPAMAIEAAGIERLMRNNPRKLSAADIEKIYRAAY